MPSRGSRGLSMRVGWMADRSRDHEKGRLNVLYTEERWGDFLGGSDPSPPGPAITGYGGVHPTLWLLKIPSALSSWCLLAGADRVSTHVRHPLQRGAGALVGEQ